MPSFLLIIFLVQLGIHLLSTVFASAFSELLWILYNRLPTSTSNAYKDVGRLRREAVRLKRDLNATSAQDQFAKWAKLQRQYDKTKAEHDLRANELRSFEAFFKSITSAVRFVFTNGLRFYLQWWYGTAPMFWLPKGWVPGYVEWVLAFPKAPSGSISIQIWFMACTSAILILAEGLAAAWALVSVKETPAATGGPAKGAKGTSSTDKKSEKKDL